MTTDDQLREIQERCRGRVDTTPLPAKLSTSASTCKPAKRPPAITESPPLPRWDNHDLPERYSWTLDDYPTVAAVMRAFLDAPEPWSLYLHGQVGTRKTSLACAIVRDFRTRFQPPCDGVLAAYFVTMEVAAQLMRTMSNAEWFYDYCRKTRLLVLDDIGSARATDHIIERLLFILTDRYDRVAKTIITANLKLADLADATDPRIADRLREGQVFHCGTESKRESWDKA